MPNEVDQQTVLNILGWEPLKEQRVKAKAKIMFKTLNNMGPNCLKELFTFKKEIVFVTAQVPYVCPSQMQTI